MVKLVLVIHFACYFSQIALKLIMKWDYIKILFTLILVLNQKRF